jgi:hypothetical protein
MSTFQQALDLVTRAQPVSLESFDAEELRLLKRTQAIVKANSRLLDELIRARSSVDAYVDARVETVIEFLARAYPAALESLLGPSC